MIKFKNRQEFESELKKRSSWVSSKIKTLAIKGDELSKHSNTIAALIMDYEREFLISGNE